MEQNFNKWHQGLLHYERFCRAGHPIAFRKSLSKQNKMQGDIIAGTLAGQLQNLQRLPDYNRHVVFTSTGPGLVAAQQILLEQSQPFTCLFPAEYRQWMQLHPDINYRLHVHLWSHFVENPDIGNSVHSLNTNEQYWLHTEGMMCGPKFGRGADHLWKWDGEKPALLKKNYAQWVS
jgi:hypothetical protein